MKSRYNLILIIFFILNNVTAQTFNATIYSSDSLCKVSQATIYNRATDKYTISDREGSFKIHADDEDTLEIRKLGFKDIKQSAGILEDSILLEKEIIKMSPVFISDDKPKRINGRQRTKTQQGLSYLKTYAFKLKVNVGDIITSIALPIKNRSKYSENGTIDFQVYSLKKEEKTFSKPKTEVITIDHIDELKRNIKLDFTDFEVQPNEVIYLMISRKISASKVPSTSKTTSLNPFFKCDESSDEENLKFKFNGTDKWYNASIYHDKDEIPSIAAKIYGYEK